MGIGRVRKEVMELTGGREGLGVGFVWIGWFGNVAYGKSVE